MREYTTNEILELDDKTIMSLADEEVKNKLGKFIREFNKREWSVRISDEYKSFEDYVQRGYVHEDWYGTGFVVDDKPVPYFHPNRSFHDEIIWLNNHLYYQDSVTFDDKLINSAVVKFYGPARTLDIITGYEENLPYLEKTDSKYINFNKIKTDEKYEYTLMSNLEKAFANGEKIWGTTELRTSLQTASRNYCRQEPSIIDRKGIEGLFGPSGREHAERKMRPSDMIAWVKSMSDSWIKFYSGKPDMQKSFEFLTETRGIGNYYGYHFSSNLARMPGIGAAQLIDAEYNDQFKLLQEADKDLTHGNLDENADYVVAGPGAMITLTSLFKGQPINVKTAMRYILAIRNNQEEFFGIAGDEEAEMHLKEASELGRFTTFGIEISCCQFSVFNRAISDYNTARNRANAPISKITKGESFCEIDSDELIKREKRKNLLVF